MYQFNIYDVHWNLVDVWYRNDTYGFKTDGDYIASKNNRGHFIYIKYMGKAA